MRMKSSRDGLERNGMRNETDRTWTGMERKRKGNRMDIAKLNELEMDWSGNVKCFLSACTVLYAAVLEKN